MIKSVAVPASVFTPNHKYTTEGRPKGNSSNQRMTKFSCTDVSSSRSGYLGLSSLTQTGL